MNESIFRFAALGVFAAGLSISIYFRSKADRSTGEKVSLRDEGLPMVLALRVGGLVMWLSMIAYLIQPAWLAWSKVGLAEPVRWAGFGLGLVCTGMIYWLFSSLGTGITPTVATRKKHQLVTRGPYRWVRHPLYTVGTSFVLSFALMADSWFIAAMAALAFILLAIRVPNEEAHLITRFGAEYRDYARATGRFLPRLWPKRRSSLGD
jgi:protein-S-isoprenylcysteine O-methyltransferase Ste14